MDGKTVVFTVGFDEKPILRGSFKLGIQPGDTVLLVYSLSGGEHERNKTLSTVKTLREVYSSAGVAVMERVLDAVDFSTDVARIARALRERRPRTIIVALGGESRYLDVAVLYASLIYRELVENAELHVYVAREDGSYDVLLNAETLRLSIGPSEAKMLCFILEDATRDVLVKKASRELKRSQSTIYALLTRMQRRGLISLEDGTAKPTPLGEAVAKTLCGDQGG